MSIWSRSMSKLWKKHEEQFIKQNLFSKRMLLLTDDFVQSHNINPFEINYSYYTLDIIQINLLINFERFIDPLIRVIEDPESCSYKKKYIEIFRLWCYKLPISQEKSILQYLRSKVSEYQIYEIYDNKDKIDYNYRESTCIYFRKPEYPICPKVTMNSESKSVSIFGITEFSNLNLDYRFKFELKDTEDYLKKNELYIRCLCIKGFQKQSCESLLKFNNLHVSMLKILPDKNNLECFNKLSLSMQNTIRYLSIGFNFKNTPLNAKQGMKAGEKLSLTIEKLPFLESLVVWGYPITTTFEALSKIKTNLQSIKIFLKKPKNFMFDQKVGELHCKSGIFEYRNCCLLYHITVSQYFKLYDEGCTPINDKDCKNFPDYLEVRSFSVIHLVGDINVTSYNDTPSNSFTKNYSVFPCIIMMKPQIEKVFIDHKKELSSQLGFLKEITIHSNRISCNINSEPMFDFMKNYMHKFNWHDLTVSVELDKQKDRKYLLSMLTRQKHLNYLRLVVRNPQYLNEIMSKIKKINPSELFEITIIDIILERHSKVSQNPADFLRDNNLNDRDQTNNQDNLNIDNTMQICENTFKDKNTENNQIIVKRAAEEIKNNNENLITLSQTKESCLLLNKIKIKLKLNSADLNLLNEGDTDQQNYGCINSNQSSLNQSLNSNHLDLTKGCKIINWWSIWKTKNPKLFKHLSWRAKIIIESDPKLTVLSRKFEFKSYSEEDC